MDDSDRTTPIDSDSDTLVGTPAPAEVLLPLLVDSTAALRTLAPLLLPCRVLAYRDSLPAGLSGAYAPLVGAGNNSVYLGLLADRTNAARIARHVTSNPEGLGELQVREIMCRVARKLAHGLKRRLRSSQAVTVTEPVFISGVIQPSDHELRAAEVVLGTVRATLVIVTRGYATSTASKRSSARPGDTGGLDDK